MSSSADIEVASFTQILILPLRLEHHGRHKDHRENPHHSTAKRLQLASSWIAHESKGDWRKVDDLYREMALFPGAGGHLETDNADRYATGVYFHPFISKLLFGKTENSPPISVLEHTRIRSVRVRARKDAPPGDRWPERLLPIRRLHLFLFPADIAILTLQIESPATPDGPPMSLPELQDLLCQFRHLYPPFYQGATPGQVPETVQWLQGSPMDLCPFGDSANYNSTLPFFDRVDLHRTPPLAAHWQSLLAPLTQTPHACKPALEHCLTVGQIVDDRIPAMTFVSLHPALTLPNPDLARLAFLDESGTGHSYAPHFLNDLTEFRYDRFWSPREDRALRSRYLCCGYNFLLVVPADDWFANNIVRKHFERHYFFMGLLVWMQKATLLGFWHRLANVVHEYSASKPNSKSRKDFFEHQKWLMDDLSDFVTRFYFREISNQVQPLELFDLWSKQLRTPGLYGQVMEHAKFLREVQMNNWQQKVQILAKYAQNVGLLAVPVSLALAFLALHPPITGTKWYLEFQVAVVASSIAAIFFVIWAIWHSKAAFRFLIRKYNKFRTLPWEK